MGHPEEVDVIICGGGPAGISHFCFRPPLISTLTTLLCFPRMRYCGPSRICWSQLEGYAHWRQWFSRQMCFFVTNGNLIGGENNRDDPWVYRPGIYVKNMQKDGMYACDFLILTLALSLRLYNSLFSTAMLEQHSTRIPRNHPTFVVDDRLCRKLSFKCSCFRILIPWDRCANILGGGSR